MIKKLINFFSVCIIGVLMVAGTVSFSFAEPGFGIGCPKSQGQGSLYCRSKARPFGLTDEEIGKVEAQEAAFAASTQEIRRDIYEKQSWLQAELSVKVPDIKKAKALQKEISDLEAKLAMARIDHIVNLKKINPGATGLMAGCPGGMCPKKANCGRPCRGGGGF